MRFTITKEYYSHCPDCGFRFAQRVPVEHYRGGAVECRDCWHSRTNDAPVSGWSRWITDNETMRHADLRM